MPHTRTRYVVVSPVRDEEQYIEDTIHSMTAQTCSPEEWIIVNDGSTDRTAEILQRHQTDYPWIKIVNRQDRGFRSAGSGVMEAFYAGYEQLSSSDWQFVIKLDGDMKFDARYFEQCLLRFDQNSRLGIGGGVIFNVINGKLKLERHPAFHVRGATKIYRRECWDDIGGLHRVVGWDTLDEVKANMLGWETRSFSDIATTQQRFTGAAAGQWNNWVKNGRASYVSGYHPLFLFAKAMQRARRKPYLVASLGLLTGYIQASLTGVPQIDDAPLIAYLRQQQLRRLLGRTSVWR